MYCYASEGVVTDENLTRCGENLRRDSEGVTSDSKAYRRNVPTGSTVPTGSGSSLKRLVRDSERVMKS